MPERRLQNLRTRELIRDSACINSAHFRSETGNWKTRIFGSAWLREVDAIFASDDPEPLPDHGVWARPGNTVYLCRWQAAEGCQAASLSRCSTTCGSCDSFRSSAADKADQWRAGTVSVGVI